MQSRVNTVLSNSCPVDVYYEYFAAEKETDSPETLRIQHINIDAEPAFALTDVIRNSELAQLEHVCKLDARGK